MWVPIERVHDFIKVVRGFGEEIIEWADDFQAILLGRGIAERERASEKVILHVNDEECRCMRPKHRHDPLFVFRLSKVLISSLLQVVGDLSAAVVTLRE